MDNVVSIDKNKPSIGKIEFNDRAVLAEAQAKLNADTIAAMQVAQDKERHDLFAKLQQMTVERNEAKSALERLRRVHPPSLLAARINAFIFENMHEIVVDNTTTLGGLYDNEQWNAFGLAIEATFRDIARGTPIGRLCGNCRIAGCGGCGFDKNDNDGAFSLPRELADELKAWRSE